MLYNNSIVSDFASCSWIFFRVLSRSALIASKLFCNTSICLSLSLVFFPTLSNWRVSCVNCLRYCFTYPRIDWNKDLRSSSNYLCHFFFISSSQVCLFRLYRRFFRCKCRSYFGLQDLWKHRPKEKESSENLHIGSATQKQRLPPHRIPSCSPNSPFCEVEFSNLVVNSLMWCLILPTNDMYWACSDLTPCTPTSSNENRPNVLEEASLPVQYEFPTRCNELPTMLSLLWNLDLTTFFHDKGSLPIISNDRPFIDASPWRRGSRCFLRCLLQWMNYSAQQINQSRRWELLKR